MSEETKSCPFCSEEIKTVAKKCKHCGKYLDQKQNIVQVLTPEFKDCPACGEEIKFIAKKCKHCGELLNESSNEISVSKKTKLEEKTLIIYIFYFVGLSLVGLIMAYIYRKDAPEWLEKHYTFQIRTFWIGLLYFFVGIILCFVFIGIVIELLAGAWLIIRCIKGIMSLNKKEAPEKVSTWWF